MARLAALVPKPRVNLTRLHGVFAGTPGHKGAGPSKQQAPSVGHAGKAGQGQQAYSRG